MLMDSRGEMLKVILDVILGRMVYRQRMLKYGPPTMSMSPLESLDKLNIRSFLG